jgi:predicted DNA-binding protein
MANTISISAQIPIELGEKLNQVSWTEERSKSYYIKKGLEQYLNSRKRKHISKDEGRKSLMIEGFKESVNSKDFEDFENLSFDNKN